MNADGSHMNPNFPGKRGCFIDKRDSKKISLVDYPTWSSKNGRFVSGEMNTPIPDGKPFEKAFKILEEATEFAKDEGYVICTDPWTKPKFEKRKDYQEDVEA